MNVVHVCENKFPLSEFQGFSYQILNYIFDLLWEKYETQTHETYNILLYLPDLQLTCNQSKPYVTKDPYDILTDNLKHGALRKIFHRLASNFDDCFLLLVYHIFTTMNTIFSPLCIKFTITVPSKPFNSGEFRHKLTVMYSLRPTTYYTVANTSVKLKPKDALHSG